MVTGVAHPIGKPTVTKAPGPTGRRSHRTSPRPYMRSAGEEVTP
jgi:hypothetical protein